MHTLVVPAVGGKEAAVALSNDGHVVVVKADPAGRPCLGLPVVAACGKGDALDGQQMGRPPADAGHCGARRGAARASSGRLWGRFRIAALL